MQKKLFSKVTIFAAPILIACGLLAFIAAATPQSGSPRSAVQTQSLVQRCSDRTLSGNYAFTVEGTLFAIPGVTLPPGVTLALRGVTMAHYDGRGNLTQVDHILVNGAEPEEEWTPGSGTYTVNPDCTGSQEIFVPGNPLSPVKIHFVVDKEGREVRQVVDANAVTAIGAKVD